MNKRSAKRWALDHAGLILKSTMECGFPFNDEHPEADGVPIVDDNGEPNADGERIHNALREVVGELLVRGER